MDQLKKLIKGTKFEKDFDDICLQFSDVFPNDKLENLQHIYSFQDKRNPRITFKLDERIICCTINEDDMWRCVPKIILTSNDCRKIGYSENDEYNDPLPTIWKDANNVSYEFYPFEQCLELTLQELGFCDDKLMLCGSINADEASISDLLEHSNIDKTLYKCANISYRIIKDTSYGQIYVIFKDGIEFAGVHTHCYSYQSGDGETNVYLYKYGESIIIENCGDVSSIVVISNLH